MFNVFSIDVEDWFHILESPASPHIKLWNTLESRVEQNVKRLLEMLNNTNIRATFFWLGWLAERHKSLVRDCLDAGHEIASHGYEHVLPHKVGPEFFRNDIDRAKKTLEDIIGKQVFGFRVAGFGVKKSTRWTFNLIKEVGYQYDSSIFPAIWEHNNMFSTTCGPHIIPTETGPLVEIPIPAAKIFCFNLFLFGGGYLRLSPIRLIKWGIGKLHKAGCPAIIYIHPREIDVNHPRLPLSTIRYFRSYYNLESTMPKLRWLCENHNFVPMGELVNGFLDAMPLLEAGEHQGGGSARRGSR